MSHAATDTGSAPEFINDDLFEVLNTDVPADELDVRVHDDGFAYVQAPNGNTVEVLPASDGVSVQRVDAATVAFEEREELSDIFGGVITCE